MAEAKQYSLSLMPYDKESGRTYRAFDLTQPLSSDWKRNTVKPTMSVFDELGVGIGLYMRFMYYSIPTFAVASLIALIPMGAEIIAEMIAEIDSTARTRRISRRIPQGTISSDCGRVTTPTCRTTL